MKPVSFLKNLYIDKKYPVSLIHFVTNRCNARCSFCFIDFDDAVKQNKNNEMTVAQIDLLTKNLGPSIQNVNLTGGEPFLRTDFVDIVRCYFKNADLSSAVINTNGAFPDRINSLIENLSKEFPTKKLIFIFSIDSFPEEHNRIRKVRGLFEKVMESYNVVKKFPGHATASVNLTCSHENYHSVNKLYDILVNEYGVQCFTPIIVRDEGVYKIPLELKKEILAAYKELTTKIMNDIRTRRIEGFDPGTLRGKVLNAKNKIQYEITSDTYLEPEFRSYCPAGSIFGVIQADGSVHPCEILDKPLGNLKDYNFDFLKLWHDTRATETKHWIKDTKCHCHWECAWTYNILSNPQYQLRLLKNAAQL